MVLFGLRIARYVWDDRSGGIEFGVLSIWKCAVRKVQYYKLFAQVSDHGSESLNVAQSLEPRCMLGSIVWSKWEDYHCSSCT